MNDVRPSVMPTYDDVLEAARRIAPHVHRTPVLRSTSVDAICGAELCFKCENLQKVGAFKARGATNAVFSLGAEEARRGVATHSSGNHAAALARAAGLRGIPAHIVMPANAPAVKRDAVRGYGAQIVECAPTLEAREQTLAGVVERTGAVFIHPYDDCRVIAGQGTAALELIEDAGPFDLILAPVGGGGLLSGTVLVAAEHGVRVLGAEPKAADDAWRSLESGALQPSLDPRTIADGLRTSLSPRTFDLIRSRVDGILCVSEESIVEAMRLVWSRMKIIIEPSAAVPLAAVMESPRRFSGRRVGIILSGGNVDLDHLPWSR